MPKDISALGGAESQAEQFPVSLVLFSIPSCAYNAINDTDLTVYLNPSTNAVSMAPGSGLVAFAPYAGLEVPQFEGSSDKTLSEVTLTLSNIRGDWSAVVAANLYRETAASIWQGNLSLPAGSSPFAVTFTGAVAFWSGRIEDIQPGRATASIILSPHLTSQTVAWPYLTYSPPGFKHMPKPGSKMIWGYTEREI